MSRPLISLHVQLRHLSVVQLILDALAMVAVGALAMFVVLLASFQNFNAVFFETGLRYETREAPAERSDNASDFTVTRGAFVMSASRFDDPARATGDFTNSETPTAWGHHDETGDSLTKLLGGVLVAGDARGTRAVLDRSTAARLGVSVGDDVVLWWEGAECRVALSGIIRAYHEVAGAFDGGLFILPEDACAHRTALWGDDDPTFLRFDGENPSSSATTWNAHVNETLRAAADFRVAGLLPAILAIGLVLWTLAALRAAARVRVQLSAPSEMLLDLGWRAGRIRRAHQFVAASLTLLAAFGSAWLSSELLFRVAGFYIQPAHWMTVGALFAAVAIGIDCFSHVRASREAARRPVRRIHPETYTLGTEGDE